MNSGFLILIVLLGVGFYVLMIRPQRQRQAQHQSMIDNVDVGEDVLTTGGIYGTIARVEGDDLVSCHPRTRRAKTKATRTRTTRRRPGSRRLPFRVERNPLRARRTATRRQMTAANLTARP